MCVDLWYYNTTKVASIIARNLRQTLGRTSGRFSNYLKVFPRFPHSMPSWTTLLLTRPTLPAMTFAIARCGGAATHRTYDVLLGMQFLQNMGWQCGIARPYPNIWLQSKNPDRWRAAAIPAEFTHPKTPKFAQLRLSRKNPTQEGPMRQATRHLRPKADPVIQPMANIMMWNHSKMPTRLLAPLCWWGKRGQDALKGQTCASAREYP